jgi:RNA polymerase sigma-70 factor (ECF subfamily)
MDSGSFEVFVREHQRMVFAIARQYVKEDNAAEDVMQEAFIRAYRGLDGLREKAHVKTWLYSLTRNAAIDWLRSHKRKFVSLEDSELDVEQPAPVRDDAKADALETVMKVLEGLRADYREIVLMRYIEKLSYQQIAEALGMTVGAVGEKLHRVRHMIIERCGL